MAGGLEQSGSYDFLDCTPSQTEFASDVLAGLSQQPKTLPSKLLYDKKGSELFDQICEIDEYYPTRTETELLMRHAAELGEMIGAGSHLVEFGSGSSHKIRIILDAAPKLGSYTAVEISRQHLLEAVAALSTDYRDLPIVAVCADYTKPFDLPALVTRSSEKRVGFFPGSTIGNFAPDAARDFLANAAAMLGPGGEFVVGADLKKDVNILRAAYNDRDGVTAEFNLNLLDRINHELGADFDRADFAHEARYNETEGRVEMHIVSRRDQTVRVDGSTIDFCAGETIHTENSYKFTVAQFQDLGRAAGFTPVKVWTDEANLFSVHYFRVN